MFMTMLTNGFGQAVAVDPWNLFLAGSIYGKHHEQVTLVKTAG